MRQVLSDLLVTGAIFAATLAICSAAGVGHPSRAEARATAATTQEDECIAVATELPRLLKVDFVLHRQPPHELDHQEVVVPESDVEITVPSMPSQCAGKIGRLIEVKTTYKTSTQPPRTLEGYGLWHGTHAPKRVAWGVVYFEDAGSGGCRCGRKQLSGGGEGKEFVRDLGKVQWVKSVARLSATRGEAGSVLKRRVMKIPSKFKAKPTLLHPDAAFWLCRLGSDG